MINKYIIYFFLMSLIGYFYECIAMVIWTGKWDNRGFLFGPIIPIYGFGALMGTILFTNYLKESNYLHVFLISMVASAILEYVVHYSMEKLFNAYWWDYSKSPFNINGRICLPASIGFGIAGIIIIFYLNPIIMPIIDKLSPLSQNVIAILLVMVSAIDFTLTISVLTNFINRVEYIEKTFDDNMESFLSNWTNEDKGIGNKFYHTVDKIEEVKENLIDRRIDKVVDSMSGTYRNVLNKIKGFKGKKYLKHNYVLTRIKEKIGVKDER